jgi:hypothetical protein
MYKASFFKVILFFGCSCSTQTNDKINTASNHDSVSTIAWEKINKLKDIDFPYVFSYYNQNDSSLTKINNDLTEFFSIDEKFFIGKKVLKDSSIIILTGMPRDLIVPVINIFTKNGRKIYSKEILIGSCGFDCGSKCDEYLIMKNEKEFIVVDSFYTNRCTEEGDIIPNTYKEYTIFMNGFINPSKIEFSKIDTMIIRDHVSN